VPCTPQGGGEETSIEVMPQANEESVFFFEKKNQKTFNYIVFHRNSVRQHNKSFLLLFFKKEVLAFLNGTVCRILVTRAFSDHIAS
jgi:hypothetical protein